MEGIGVLVSPGGFGKSQLGIQLMCKAALGENFLGYTAGRSYRSGLLSLEMGPPLS